MTKTTFVKGTKVTSAYLNALQSLQFDGVDLDGHYPKLTNAALDNTPGSLLNDWIAFRDALSITGVNALVASYIGGVITTTDGNSSTIANGSILIANNATNYIYVNKNGVVETSTTYPTLALPIAKIVTVGGVVSGSIIDLRPRYRIAPIAQATKIFGGLGGEGSLTVSSGTVTISGEHYYTDITVSAGATLQVNGSAYLYCSGNVSIAGTVNVIASVKGGQGYFGVLKNQVYPNSPGSGLGGGNTVNASASPAYDFFTSPVGSGGAGGWVEIQTSTPSANITTPAGGNGGGCFIIEAAGTINISGTINANGVNGQGNTDIVMNPASTYTGTISGGGGGSGGLIFLKSLKSIFATASALLSVKGGNGGNNFPNPSTSISAGGGGGGYIALYSPATNTTGASINLSGGISQYPSGINGSVSGGSFAGVGGAPGFPGSSGLLILRSIIPV